ncbi:Hypothetical protein NGAL_HAMBI1145_56200 [Neorhizobium galegae bv. officinalis]|uniref:Uncharacterized protein n=1 Tax=Neorhizobium galegae bv. officinalis TaxID=323656 RepID=A0A0T7G0V1_NEOGA|nr:hypothetical protein [Neorhizobium galegae]CDZ40904.1 Hypothetical protein NGAL_HAMBI1145_56200 [Neorhizobium galegae bv. officinalis]
MTEKINVLEDGKPLSYTYADMMHFHGFGYPGGVAHAFKVMQRAMPLLSPDGPPERREIVIRTAFRGPGGRDAFEMVTRGLTEGRYMVDHGLEKPDRGNILERYVFELSYRGKTVTLQLKEGHVREEFIIVSRKPDRTPAEEDRLVWLKQEMADRLLLAPAEAVYEEA